MIRFNYFPPQSPEDVTFEVSFLNELRSSNATYQVAKLVGSTIFQAMPKDPALHDVMLDHIVEQGSTMLRHDLAGHFRAGVLAAQES